MPLIDRDKVWELVGEFTTTVKPGSKLEGVISRYANAIDNAPVVDAIPVTWLIQMMRQEEGWGNMARADYIKQLIWEWHNEDEDEAD